MGIVQGGFNYTAPMYAPQGIAHHVDAGVERTVAVEEDNHTNGGVTAGNEVSATHSLP